MALKLIAGQQGKVVFSFYDEQGNILTNITNPIANLYSSKDGSLVDSDLSISFDTAGQEYFLLYTPDVSLNGTYYFIASGTDSLGIARKSTVFVDILPLEKVDFLVDYNYIAKFIDDINIDYSVLPSLVLTARDWINDYIGGILLPKSFQEKYYIPEDDTKIFLENFPILEIKSIVDNFGNAITDYTILDSKAGILELNTSTTLTLYRLPTSIEYLIIDYVAGYNPIPETVYTALAMLVGYLYRLMKYQNYDRIRMLSVDAILSDSTLDKIKELLKPFAKNV